MKALQKKIPLALGLLLSGAILFYLFSKHFAAVEAIGDKIDWAWVWVSAFCAFGSYSMAGLALEEALLIFEHKLLLTESLGVALVSTTINYFISTAGASGFALKAHLLRKRGVPYGTTVLVSVLSSVILYLVLAVILAQGLLYLVLHLHGMTIAVMESALGLLILLAVSVPILVFLFSRGIRGKIMKRLSNRVERGIFFFLKTGIPKENFEAFERQLEEGLSRVRQGRVRLTRMILFTGADWVFLMSSLYFAFRAVGVSLSVGYLTAGFTMAMAAMLVPVLPAGLGIMEGSLAAVFSSFGIDWDKALVAALLYRLAYQALPGLVSVFVFWGLKISEPSLAQTVMKDAREGNSLCEK